jgi:hypothetical protein
MAKSKTDRFKPNHDALEREVLLAMRAERWLAPETEAEVFEAEKQLASEQITVPTSFDHPRELLHCVRIPRVRQLPPKVENTEETENLARAARDGGTISSEVEERMKRDRDAAEAQDPTK